MDETELSHPGVFLIVFMNQPKTDRHPDGIVKMHSGL